MQSVFRQHAYDVQMESLLEQTAFDGGGQAVRSASNLAYDTLLDLIVTRALPAGTVLREQVLAESVGVSRTPLREALSRLAGEGLVARQANRSLVVKPITVRDYIEALHVRALLEAETARRAVGRLEADEVAALRDRIEALLAGPEPSAREHWAVDDAVHQAIAQASGNDLMAGIIQGLRRKTRLFNLKRMPNRFRPGCEEHLVLLDAIASGDAEAAGRAMAEHIDHVRTSILEKLAEI